MADVQRMDPAATDRKQHRQPDFLEAGAKLKQAEQLRRAGKLDRAQDICEALLRRYPDYYGALQTIALILTDKNDYSGALHYLARAAMLNPKDWFILWGLSHTYLRLGAGQMAARILQMAMERKPDDPDLLAMLGDIYRSEREYELAGEAYRKSLQLSEVSDDAFMGLGLTLEHLGEAAEAAAIFGKVVERRPRAARALYALSQLPAGLIDVDVLNLIGNAAPEGKQSPEEFQSWVDFTMATALGNAGRHAEAWQHLVKANSAIYPQHKRKAGSGADHLKNLIAQVSRSPQPVGPSLQSDEYPISLFILGPSRSGKTTMERLVGTLPGVKRGYENPIATYTARRACNAAGLPPLHAILEVPHTLDGLIRDFYLEELKERAGDAKVFTNTHPGRIFDAYRMGSIIPNVRFIFIKRDMDDITLRIFAKKYKTGHSYAYDLNTIREYLTWYYRMMDVLTERLPSLCRIVHYEDMVADPRKALATAAELCGLPPPSGEIPPLGDDRGRAEPYKKWMAEAASPT